MNPLESALEELLKAGYTIDEIRNTLEEIAKGINNPTENEAGE